MRWSPPQGVLVRRLFHFFSTFLLQPSRSPCLLACLSPLWKRADSRGRGNSYARRRMFEAAHWGNDLMFEAAHWQPPALLHLSRILFSFGQPSSILPPSPTASLSFTQLVAVLRPVNCMEEDTCMLYEEKDTCICMRMCQGMRPAPCTLAATALLHVL